MKTDTPSARSSRRSAGMQSIVNLSLALLLLLGVNYIAFKHYEHQDLSASQFYTLSPKTEDVLGKLDSKLTIYTFLDPKNGVQAEQINTLLKEYERVGGKNVNLEKIDPDFNAARANELNNELHFADSTDFLVIFKYKTLPPRFVKEQDLYDVNPMTGQSGGFKGEQQFTSAITALIEGKAAKIYFTEGHGEHSAQDPAPIGYGSVAQSVKNDNIEIDNLNLAKMGDVPADADAVVIAGPQISFSPIEIEALDKYLAKNGKLIVLLDPFFSSGLDDLLKKYGLRFEDDLVLWRHMTTQGVITMPIALIMQGGFAPHPITGKMAQANYNLKMLNARSLTLLLDENGQPDSKTQFLLQTMPDAWGWITKDATPPADPTQLEYNKITDLPGPLDVAAVYDGGPITDPATKATGTSTRIIAVGSSKFIQNDTTDEVGTNFFTNAVDWLVKKDAVLDIPPKQPLEYGVNLNQISYTTTIWWAILVVPGSALLLGIFTWFSRRK